MFRSRGKSFIQFVIIVCQVEGYRSILKLQTTCFTSVKVFFFFLKKEEPGCDITDFEINLTFLIMPFFTWLNSQDKTLNILRAKRTAFMMMMMMMMMMRVWECNFNLKFLDAFYRLEMCFHSWDIYFLMSVVTNISLCQTVNFQFFFTKQLCIFRTYMRKKASADWTFR